MKRQRIEHAFALLKGRFRKLKVQMDIDNNGDIPDIAKAACVMYNIALLTDDNIYDFLEPLNISVSLISALIASGDTLRSLASCTDPGQPQ
jgi:hypothetical protein